MQIDTADGSWLKVLLGLQTTLIFIVGGAFARFRLMEWPKFVKEIESKTDMRHGENKREIESVKDSVDKLTASIVGVYGQGGLLQDSKLDRRRRHRLGNQLMVAMLQQQELSVWAARAGEKIDVPFVPFPTPSRDLEDE